MTQDVVEEVEEPVAGAIEEETATFVEAVVVEMKAAKVTSPVVATALTAA